MFLAVREIRQSPARFILISLIVFLVSYLAFFLTGLANGLARSFSELVENWDTTHVAVTEDSNNNILASRITEDQLDSAQSALGDVSPVHIRPTVITIPGEDEDGDGEDDHRSAYILGVTEDSPAAPTISEGAFPANDTEVLADSSLKRRGFAIGDSITSPDTDTTWTISGFSDNQQFQASPALFLTHEAFNNTFDFALVTRTDVVTAAVLLLPKDTASAGLSDDQHHALDDAGLTVLTKAELKDEIPGYRAQILTFMLMIISLIVIIAFVLGIFIYVLTLQKISIFGIMKAQGVPTSYILISGIIQTMLLTAVGVLLGMGLSLATGAALVDKVPFYADPRLFAGVGVAFAVFTLIGGLAPIRTVTRIDPVEAIS